MSKITSTTITNPNDKEDICALVQVTGQELYYLLRPIEIIGKYTISFWVKATSSETIVVHYGEESKSFAIFTQWQRVIFSFNAEHIDNVMIQFTTGTYYLYNTQLENGNVATDYNVSPEDLQIQLAQIESSMNTQYSEVVQSLNSFKVEVGSTYATQSSVNDKISKLTVDLNGFKTEVNEKVQAVADNLSANYSTTVQMKSAIKQSASSILQTVSGTYATKESVTASLELKVGVDENDKIVSMINASADEINLKSNRISIESDYFSLTKEGVFAAVAGLIGGWNVTDSNINKIFETTVAGESVTYKTILDTELQFSGTYPDYSSGEEVLTKVEAGIDLNIIGLIYQSTTNPWTRYPGLHIWCDEDLFLRSVNSNIAIWGDKITLADVNGATHAVIENGDIVTLSGSSLNNKLDSAIATSAYASTRIITITVPSSCYYSSAVSGYTYYVFNTALLYLPHVSIGYGGSVVPYMISGLRISQTECAFTMTKFTMASDFSAYLTALGTPIVTFNSNGDMVIATMLPANYSSIVALSSDITIS